MNHTLNATASKWGEGSFNSGADSKKIKVGRTNAPNIYYGRCQFPSIPSDWYITKMTLYLYKEDDYPNNPRNLLFGGATGYGFNETLSFSFTTSIAKGNGSRSLDLTSYAKTIQNFSGDSWYLHIRNGDNTSNSYCEFHGPAASTTSKRPYIAIEYQQGTMYYGTGNAWTQCLVYYGVNGKWEQVIPYYGTNNAWQQV